MANPPISVGELNRGEKIISSSYQALFGENITRQDGSKLEYPRGKEAKQINRWMESGRGAFIPNSFKIQLGFCSETDTSPSY